MIIIAGTVILILTLSRSGWLSFSVAFGMIMVVTFFHPLIKRKFVFGRIVIILGTLLLVVAMSGTIMKRITKSDSGAVSFRWEWMTVAVKMANDKPILGFGLNSFVWSMPPYTKYGNYSGVIDKYGDDLPVVHNIYLLVLSEQGVIGLMLFLLFFFHLFRTCWRGVKNYTEPFSSMVNLGCFGALIALSIDGMSSFFIRNDNCGRIFIIVVALIVAIQWWYKENRLDPFVQQQPASL